jgi:hypothetical protein
MISNYLGSYIPIARVTDEDQLIVLLAQKEIGD